MPQYKGHEVSEELLKTITEDLKSAEPSEEKLSEIRGNERRTYAKDIKAMLAKALPKAVEGISPDAHIRDFITEVAERAQKVAAAPAGDPPKPKETLEEMSSRLKAENDKILRDERANLRREAMLNETVSIAIGKFGLDPEYKDAFTTKLNSLHPIEVNDDRISYRDGEGYLYDKQGKPASSEMVAEKLLTAYPKLKVAVTPGPNLHTTGSNMSAKTLDKSGVARLGAQVGNILENIQKKG